MLHSLNFNLNTVFNGDNASGTMNVARINDNLRVCIHFDSMEDGMEYQFAGRKKKIPLARNFLRMS